MQFTCLDNKGFVPGSTRSVLGKIYNFAFNTNLHLYWDCQGSTQVCIHCWSHVKSWAGDDSHGGLRGWYLGMLQLLLEGPRGCCLLLSPVYGGINGHTTEDMICTTLYIWTSVITLNGITTGNSAWISNWALFLLLSCLFFCWILLKVKEYSTLNRGLKGTKKLKGLIVEKYKCLFKTWCIVPRHFNNYWCTTKVDIYIVNKVN